MCNELYSNDFPPRTPGRTRTCNSFYFLCNQLSHSIIHFNEQLKTCADVRVYVSGQACHQSIESKVPSIFQGAFRLPDGRRALRSTKRTKRSEAMKVVLTWQAASDQPDGRGSDPPGSLRHPQDRPRSRAIESTSAPRSLPNAGSPGSNAR